jgi:hypothetical protein
VGLLGVVLDLYVELDELLGFDDEPNQLEELELLELDL